MTAPFRFVCRACAAKRDIVLACDAVDVDFYASFIRCPVCMKTDRGNTALYWGVFALKVVALSAVMAFVAAVTTPFLYVLVLLAPVALWAEHLRFLRRLDLALMGARVSGGPRPELLLRR